MVSSSCIIAIHRTWNRIKFILPSTVCYAMINAIEFVDSKVLVKAFTSPSILAHICIFHMDGVCEFDGSIGFGRKRVFRSFLHNHRCLKLLLPKLLLPAFLCIRKMCVCFRISKLRHQFAVICKQRLVIRACKIPHFIDFLYLINQLYVQQKCFECRKLLEKIVINLSRTNTKSNLNKKEKYSRLNSCICLFFVTFKCEHYLKYRKSPIKYHL